MLAVELIDLFVGTVLHEIDFSIDGQFNARRFCALCRPAHPQEIRGQIATRRSLRIAAPAKMFGDEARVKARKLSTRQKGKAEVCRATLGPVR
jgi:hypothetical protein